ncbi:MAG: nucleotide exchange factor GrpE [Azoarcus sp.]|jgi:molecular chaperone GrpE|nr:nucleotide exchange factor GrpE [Azoarcus sp.]
MQPDQPKPAAPIETTPPQTADKPKAEAPVPNPRGEAAYGIELNVPPLPTAKAQPTPQPPFASGAPSAPATEPPVPDEPAIDPILALIETEARLAEAEIRLAEQRDAWMRAKAETENVRRRGQEEIAKTAKFTGEKFAGAMLPVKDALEAALAVENQTLEHLREGVELTLRQLVAAFEGAGVAEENPLGQKFDPNKHQAIGTLESEAEPNTVIDVLQKGYLLHERVIRPAMVMVARARA